MSDRDTTAGGHKEVAFAGVDILRFAGRKVIELWSHGDDLGLREQPGVPIHAGAIEP